MFANDAIAVAFVSVSDRGRALGFYRDTLGLVHSAADQFGDFFELGSGRLRMTVMPEHQGHGVPLFGWQVTDITAVATALRERGVALTRYPGFDQDDLGIWHAPDGGAKVAWFSDPDGNCLSLNQVD